jgi:hypothetical protein
MLASVGTAEVLLIPLILLVAALMCGEFLLSGTSNAARDERAAHFRALRRELRRTEQLGQRRSS